MDYKLTKRQYEDYKELCDARDNGRMMTPDALRVICASCDYDAEKIGQYFLELLPKVCPNYDSKIEFFYNEDS